MFDLGHQSSFVVRCKLFGHSMPLCRHSIAFTICLRDGQTAKSCIEQVVPGDVHCCVVMVCLCPCLRCMLNKFQVLYACTRPHISLLPQFLLISDNAPCWRKERTTLPQGLALRQEQRGCCRFRSFLYSFWSLCFSFFAAASGFVQAALRHFKRRVSQNHCFADFLDQTRCPKR